jgi:hypothetical protein
MGQSGHGKSSGLYFSYGNKNENHQLGTGFLYTKVSAVKRVQFVSERMPYIVLRGHWCNTILFNVHPSSKEKSDESKVCTRN